MFIWCEAGSGRSARPRTPGAGAPAIARANQLRVLLATAAFVLMEELRLRLKTIGLASAQVETLRLRLLKIGGRVERSVRRVVVHLVEDHPWKHLWREAALALGAAVP